MIKKLTLTIVVITTTLVSYSQYPVIKGVDVRVKFDEKIREWNGLGFNYVETAQTPDYNEFPQEYGGFSLLDENEKSEIIDMVFGENGLKVGLVKCFTIRFIKLSQAESLTMKQQLSICVSLLEKDSKKRAPGEVI